MTMWCAVSKHLMPLTTPKMTEQHSSDGVARSVAPCGYEQLETTTPTPSLKGHGQPGVYHLPR